MNARHIARWDLDKTYLRTEFDTFKDLLRTAIERPDEKRSHPGAPSLLRELGRAGVEVHILSGSPEQMRSRLEDKLRLDGITWASFILKPNLQNMLRLRFRALRDQLGYKLPALLTSRAHDPSTHGVRETLFGDDAEADAFVYSLYADVVSGRVGEAQLLAICARGRMYEDVWMGTLGAARKIAHEPAVERILIHLERQTPPSEFDLYGPRVVPFYNYLQAAFVVHEDGRVPAEGVLRVAQELVVQHRFVSEGLVKSYEEIARRGHLRGTSAADLASAFERSAPAMAAGARREIEALVAALPGLAAHAGRTYRRGVADSAPDYLSLVHRHNRRRRGR